MSAGNSRRRGRHGRCRRCGRFIGGSDANLCSSCLAIASADKERETSDGNGLESVTTEFGRRLADLGLDVRFLSQNAEGSPVSRVFRRRRVDTPEQATPLAPPASAEHPLPQPPLPQPPLPQPLLPQPPLRALRDSLLVQARRDSVIARSDGLRSRRMPDTPEGKSVLTFIGPVAAAQRASERSHGGRPRRPLAAAQPIAIAVALICLSAALGAAVPILLSLLGR